MLLNRINNFKFFFKDPNKKGWGKMFVEIIHFWWVKKELPLDYFRRFLYRKEVKNYTDYLGYRQYLKFIYSEKMTFTEITSILNNKLSFDTYFKNFNLPIPKVVSYNLRNKYYFDNTINICDTEGDLISFFNHMFESSLQKSFIIKPIIAQGGSGIILLKKETLTNQIKANANILLNESFIHQEVIIQHPEINKIHSKCINTLRIETYIDNKRKTHILSVVMRFGIGNGFIDNISSGGFFISVNLGSGQLQGIGRQMFTKGIETFISHPNSNILLEGFKVPFFNEACELAKKATNYLPNRIIGWDIAISNKGPVIIEGNHNPGLDITDIAYGGYCRHPLIKEILNEI